VNDAQIIGILYCLISLVSAFLILFSADTILKIFSRYSHARYVYFSFLFAGLSGIFDCAYPLRERQIIHFSAFANYALTLAYVLFTTLTGVFWIIYSEKKQNSWFVRTKKTFYFYLAPLIVFVIFIVSSPLTHLYYYFDGDSYQRGPLFLIVSVLLFVYVVQSGVSALVRSFQKQHYADRNDFRRLFAYAFVYLLIQAIQLTFANHFPYRTVGVMLFFQVFLIQNMKEEIGIDALTCINNRYAVDRYLAGRMNPSDVFDVVFLDVDKFKTINDEFGHAEGDTALRCVAEAFKQVAPKSSFFARFGGDEFLIVDSEPDDAVADTEAQINAKIEEILKSQNFPCSITVSAGVIRKDESVGSIPDLLAKADEKLYQRKAEKRIVK